MWFQFLIEDIKICLCKICHAYDAQNIERNAQDVDLYRINTHDFRLLVDFPVFTDINYNSPIITYGPTRSSGNRKRSQICLTDMRRVYREYSARATS